MEKVNNIQKQMANISKKMETLWKNKNKMLQICKHCSKNEECLDVCFGRLEWWRKESECLKKC